MLARSLVCGLGWISGSPYCRQSGEMALSLTISRAAPRLGMQFVPKVSDIERLKGYFS